MKRISKPICLLLAALLLFACAPTEQLTAQPTEALSAAGKAVTVNGAAVETTVVDGEAWITLPEGGAVEITVK